MKKAYVLLALAFVVSVCVYPHLPEQVPTHWDSTGEADKYSSREMGAFFMPVLMIALYCALTYLPRLDPKKKVLKAFKVQYAKVILVTLGFLLYVHILTLAMNFYFLPVIRLLGPGLGVLLYLVGDLLPHTKRNWFIGIRTPWTLSSAKVWKATHHRASLPFKAAGLTCALTVIFNQYALFFGIGILLLGTIDAFLFSYRLYTRK